MTESARTSRKLSAEFEKSLDSGVLNPILKLIQGDRDLIAEIRNERLDVYCKGNRLVGISPLDGGGFELTSDKKFWPTKRQGVTLASEVTDFCERHVPFIKHCISMHSPTGKEIEFEQMLIRACNMESMNADYVCVDRQGPVEEGRGRTDVVGVFWPSKDRGHLKHLAPALIEVKYGLSGGVDGIADQIAGYYDGVVKDLPGFVNELQEQLRQKARLKLLSGLSDGAQQKIAKLPISDSIEDLRIVLAMVDYNPRSRVLNHVALSELPFASQIDIFYLGFAMWHENRFISSSK